MVLPADKIAPTMHGNRSSMLKVCVQMVGFESYSLPLVHLLPKRTPYLNSLINTVIFGSAGHFPLPLVGIVGHTSPGGWIRCQESSCRHIPIILLFRRLNLWNFLIYAWLITATLPRSCKHSQSQAYSCHFCRLCLYIFFCTSFHFAHVILPWSCDRGKDKNDFMQTIDCFICYVCKSYIHSSKIYHFEHFLNM